MRAILNHIDGVDGGLVMQACTHVCKECTHPKRYFSDLQSATDELRNACADQVSAGEREQERIPSEQVSAAGLSMS